MELKVYQLLAKIRNGMLSKIRHEAINKTEYCQDKPDRVLEWMEFIANPAKWDYSGLLSKEDKKLLEVLEYLIDDDMTEIRQYKEWKPIK